MQIEYMGEPIMPKIAKLKYEAEKSNKVIRKLYFAAADFEDLKRECGVHFYSGKNLGGINKILGIDFEVLDIAY